LGSVCWKVPLFRVLERPWSASSDYMTWLDRFNASFGGGQQKAEPPEGLGLII